MLQSMYGSLPDFGLRGGFLNPQIPAQGLELGPSVPIITRGLDRPIVSDELKNHLTTLQRGEVTGDMSQILLQLGLTFNEFQRAITSATSALPVRENLEAEAKVLVPLDTPVRNMLPRTPGAGTASQWRQMTSIGGGYGVSTTVTTGIASATQTVGSTAGMQVGDTLYFATAATTRIVSSITNATTVVLTATVTTTTSEVVTKISVQPGSGSSNRMFFAESGAPSDHATTYANISVGYKLLGTYGSVTGFAMAAGANFQNQLAMEKTNAIRNLMLNEEHALINGDSTDIKAPWGDGSTALAFNGLVNLIATGNGTPALQVQTSVGALTVAHIDQQINRLWLQGAQELWMLMNPQECASLAHLAEASGSITRVMFTTDGQGVLGVKITGYVHPTTGMLVNILPSRFLSPGTILYGCKYLPDGSPAADVQVLPQVQLPALAPNENVQGYTAQDIAPTTAAPQVYPFMVSVYEVLRLKSALHFAKSTGVAAV